MPTNLLKHPSTPSSMIQVVSFDVDGTLVDSSFADLVWLEGVPQLYAETHNVDLDTAKKIVLQEYQNVGADDLRWYELSYWFSHFNLKGSHRDFLLQYKDNVKIYEEVPGVLERLSRSHNLIVTSNAHRDFLSLTLRGIEHYFSRIFSVTSDFREPRKYERFYNKILRELKITPEELAHVGDDYVFDYEVPSSLGIKAFYLDRKGGKGFKSLREVEDIVATFR